MSKRVLVALAGLGAFAVQAAQPAPVGDATVGAEKSAACVACHGMDGNSPAAEWPKLAGQHADYIFRHTKMMRDGGRENLLMLPFVQGLTDQDIADIAAYYTRQRIMPGVADDSVIGEGKPTYASLGGQLFQAGKPELGMPACSACHGPTGRGIPGAGYPALAGQHATYTADRLRHFHGGAHYGTDSDASTIMTAIAVKLNDTEINALATYIEGLHRFDPKAQELAQSMPQAEPAAEEPPAENQDAEDTDAGEQTEPGT